MEKKNFLGGTDLEGKKVGSLRVGRILSTFDGPRRRIKWAAVCERCGTQGQSFYSDELEQALLGKVGRGAARCMYPGCGREAIAELANETAAKALRQEQDRAEKVAKQREDTLQAELDNIRRDYERQQNKLAEAKRAQLSRVKDDEFRPDPKAPKRLPVAEVNDYNNAQFEVWLKHSPTVNATEANMQEIAKYFERQKLNIISADQFAKAYDRLDEYNLLPDQRLQPKAPVHRQPVFVQPQPDEEPADKIIGYDGTNGATREFTAFEVSQMSGDEYRKAFFRRTL